MTKLRPGEIMGGGRTIDEVAIIDVDPQAFTEDLVRWIHELVFTRFGAGNPIKVTINIIGKEHGNKTF